MFMESEPWPLNLPLLISNGARYYYQSIDIIARLETQETISQRSEEGAPPPRSRAETMSNPARARESFFGHIVLSPLSLPTWEITPVILF